MGLFLNESNSEGRNLQSYFFKVLCAQPFKVFKFNNRRIFL